MLQPKNEFNDLDMNGSHTTVVLAMSADGKIADRNRSPARFGSSVDKAHLETQIAQADGVLFGAETLRAYHTTLTVTNPDLLQQRQQQEKPPQPTHIVCSQSAQFAPQYSFFRQPVPRWLFTTPQGAEQWRDRPEFDRVLILPTVQAENQTETDWRKALQHLASVKLRRLVISGGGELVASLLAADLIDELWLTVCPLILGGRDAATPVGGMGFAATIAPRLQLLSCQTQGQEIFLHYKIRRDKN